MNIKYSKKMVSIKAVTALIVLFAFLAMCTPIQGIEVPPPDNQAPVVSGILDQSVSAGTLFATISLDDYVVDDSDVSEIIWTASGETNLTVVIDADRVANITYPDGWSGSETITFTATDLGGLSGSDDASFTVVNQAPVVSGILDQSVSAGTLFATISLDDYVVDDSDVSDLTWSTSGASGITVDVDVDRVATITYPDGWTGSETITFTATDQGGLSGSDDASFTVVNQAPMVSDILDQSVPAGTLFATINLDLHVQDDSADSEITWTTSGETDLTVAIDADRVANITYPAGWTGSETITFTATDPGGLSGSDDASFTVVNQAPMVSDILDQSVPAGELFATINLDLHVQDDSADSEITWTTSMRVRLSNPSRHQPLPLNIRITSLTLINVV